MKMRGLVLAVALAAGSVSAQQSVDIKGEDLTSGAADARLAGIGREAAAASQRVVVTAPQYWHGAIAAKLRAGGGSRLTIVLRDGFYENVVLRVEAAPAEPPPRPETAPAVARTPLPAERPPPPAPAAAPPPVVAPPPPPTAPAAAVVPARPSIPTPAPAPVASAPEEPIRPPVFDRFAEPSDVAEERAFLEKAYNDNRRIRSRLKPSDLRTGDTVYVRNGAAVIVRRDGGSLDRFWLEGQLNLEQNGIVKEGGNKYQVTRSGFR
ncbi:hypothetical protein [Dokdonella koreensis]|uniref:hypothetical protein n=1 Tax=Dokdonella koreensis TaxID=323415 RepID=UPI000A63BD45|nr:hypothetical protein [Dokdonella koreensis]